MTIRKGIDQIQDRNKVADERKNRPFIPELRLFEDEDIAVIRFLTDDPLDVDFHTVVDESISKAPQYHYCTKGETGDCELCNQGVGNIKRMIMFWVYVYKVLHARSDQEGKWASTTSPSGKKTMYQEDINTVKLFRYSFGKGRYLWDELSDAHEQFGTWKDRDYLFKRRGAPRDPNTMYKITPLADKSPMRKDISDLIGKLPALESIAKGVATSIDIQSVSHQEKSDTKAQAQKNAPASKPKAQVKAKVEKPVEEDPEVTVNIDDASDSTEEE
jgi:hypothetical protein